MDKPISKLIELAEDVTMTEEQRREQRRSFVYGNTTFENPDITRELIGEVDAEMEAADRAPKPD